MAEMEDWKVYQSVGSCIYCGSTQQLSKEHALPLGLGGNYILPNASCEKCRKITEAFEHTCLRRKYLIMAIAPVEFSRGVRQRPWHNASGQIVDW
jgi:hypothetical protein